MLLTHARSFGVGVVALRNGWLCRRLFGRRKNFVRQMLQVYRLQLLGFAVFEKLKIVLGKRFDWLSVPVQNSDVHDDDVGGGRERRARRLVLPEQRLQDAAGSRQRRKAVSKSKPHDRI